MANIFSIIFGGLGLGSLVAVYFTFRLNKKQFVYEQKLMAYAKFLEAFSQASYEAIPSRNSQVLHQVEILRLLAPDDIYNLAKEYEMRNSKNVLVRTPIDTSKLISLMKSDLNKST